MKAFSLLTLTQVSDEDFTQVQGYDYINRYAHKHGKGVVGLIAEEPTDTLYVLNVLMANKPSLFDERIFTSKQDAEDYKSREDIHKQAYLAVMTVDKYLRYNKLK